MRVLNWLSNVFKDIAQLEVGLCRMDNFVYVKNKFLTSCYKLEVRMDNRLVQDRKRFEKSHFS